MKLMIRSILGLGLFLSLACNAGDSPDLARTKKYLKLTDNRDQANKALNDFIQGEQGKCKAMSPPQALQLGGTGMLTCVALPPPPPPQKEGKEKEGGK